MARLALEAAAAVLPEGRRAAEWVAEVAAVQAARLVPEAALAQVVVAQVRVVAPVEAAAPVEAGEPAVAVVGAAAVADKLSQRFT